MNITPLPNEYDVFMQGILSGYYRDFPEAGKIIVEYKIFQSLPAEQKSAAAQSLRDNMKILAERLKQNAYPELWQWLSQAESVQRPLIPVAISPADMRELSRQTGVTHPSTLNMAAEDFFWDKIIGATTLGWGCDNAMQQLYCSSDSVNEILNQSLNAHQAFLYFAGLPSRTMSFASEINNDIRKIRDAMEHRISYMAILLAEKNISNARPLSQDDLALLETMSRFRSTMFPEASKLTYELCLDYSLLKGRGVTPEDFQNAQRIQNDDDLRVFCARFHGLVERLKTTVFPRLWEALNTLDRSRFQFAVDDSEDLQTVLTETLLDLKLEWHKEGTGFTLYPPLPQDVDPETLLIRLATDVTMTVYETVTHDKVKSLAASLNADLGVLCQLRDSLDSQLAAAQCERETSQQQDSFTLNREELLFLHAVVYTSLHENTNREQTDCIRKLHGELVFATPFMEELSDPDFIRDRPTAQALRDCLRAFVGHLKTTSYPELWNMLKTSEQPDKPMLSVKLLENMQLQLLKAYSSTTEEEEKGKLKNALRQTGETIALHLQGNWKADSSGNLMYMPAHNELSLLPVSSVNEAFLRLVTCEDQTNPGHCLAESLYTGICQTQAILEESAMREYLAILVDSVEEQNEQQKDSESSKKENPSCL